MYAEVILTKRTIREMFLHSVTSSEQGQGRERRWQESGMILLEHWETHSTSPELT